MTTNPTAQTERPVLPATTQIKSATNWQEGLLAIAEGVLISKRNHVLHMQWLKNHDAQPINHDNDPHGGADLVCMSFAQDMVTVLQDMLTRRDLHAIALEFLLELERRNQDTKTPRDIDAIRSCVRRISQQIDHSAAPMRPLQGANEPLPYMRLVSGGRQCMQKVAGERFEIILPTSQKSGVKWSAAASPAGSVSLVNRIYRDFGDDSAQPGLETIFTFQAMHAGESTLRFVMVDPDQPREILQEREISVAISAPVSNVVAIRHPHPLHADNDIPAEAGDQ